jgi:mRNA interferase MazF
MKAGTVVIANFSGATGIKRRPALVISTALYQAERPDVILTIITSQVTKSHAKTDYILQDWLVAGLTQPSAVRIISV